jgi:hypothetical protein
MGDNDDQQKTTNVPIQQPAEQRKQPSTSASPSSSEPQTPAPQTFTVNTISQPDNRTELISRARSFLTSPQIRHEDISAKRRFLVEKGLSDAEIAGLLQELVSISCILNYSYYHLCSLSKHHLFHHEHILNLHLQTYRTSL